MKKGFMMTFVLLLVAVGAYFVSETYAKYTESVTKSGNVTVAKWAFADDNSTGNLTINLAENYNTATLADKTIAPGTSGSFDIALSNENTQTAVDVTVEIRKENAPNNLKFYTNKECTDEFEIDQLTAVIAAKGSLDTKTIYWKWAYEADESATPEQKTAVDSDDTTVGKTANNMTIQLAITGTQKTPSKSGVTSGWN